MTENFVPIGDYLADRELRHKKSRGWCFTINNYTDSDMADVVVLDDSPGFKYAIAGFEVGKNLTPHIQGFVYFDNEVRLKTVSKLLPRARLEPSSAKKEGNLLWRNYVYCQKDGDFIEIGEFPQQGRASIRSIEAAIRNPHRNMALFTQYRKSYRETQLVTKKKDRYLHLTVDTQAYRDEDPNRTYIGSDLSTYNYESTVFYIEDWLAGDDLVKIMRWKEGFPPSIKRGYELIKFDPDVVTIIVSAPEYQKMKRHLSSHLTKENIISIEDIQCLDQCVEDGEQSE